MKRLIIGLALLVGLAAGSLAVPRVASALSGSEFQAGRIIDDAVFFNPNGMSQAQIQDFLNAKVPVCDTNGTKMYNGQTRAAYSIANGNPPPFTCLKDYRQDVGGQPAEEGLCNGMSAGNKSAAHIIYEVAQSCGINPRVLLVLLQKEQSLVTDDWPWPRQFTKATGYFCPDSDLPADVDANNNGCYDQFEGYANQVYFGARQFKRYARFPSSYSYRVNRNNSIQFSPNGGCGSSTVFIQSQATAGLYNYTPYQPNQAALNNLYGLGDGCSAYGNRNFWRMYNDWFGSTFSNRPLLTNTAHPDGTLIQEGGRSEVYLIVGQERYHVSDLQVFASRNFNWNKVRQATLKDMTLPVNGASITYKSGSLVRGNSDTKIYYVRCNYTACTKQHISSFGVFQELGFTAGDVYVINQAAVNAMSEGAAISSSTVHPQDTLVRDPATNKVYIIGIGHRHWIPSLDVFVAHNFNWDKVELANAGDLALPESGFAFPEGTLIRQPNVASVYVVDQDAVGNFSKRLVTSQTVFAGLGYNPDDVMVDSWQPGPNGPNLAE